VKLGEKVDDIKENQGRENVKMWAELVEMRGPFISEVKNMHKEN